MTPWSVWPLPWNSPGKSAGEGCHFLLHVFLNLAPFAPQTLRSSPVLLPFPQGHTCPSFLETHAELGALILRGSGTPGPPSSSRLRRRTVGVFGDTWPMVNPFKPQEAWDDSREDIWPEQPLQAPSVPGGPSAAPRRCLRRTPRAQRPPHRPQAASACLRGLALAPLLPASARSGSSSPGAHLPLSAGRPSARPPDLSPGVIPLGPPGPSSGFVPQN